MARGSGLIAVLLLLPVGGSRAAELTVEISNVDSARGQIGCALYASASGFPMDPKAAIQVWQAASTGGVRCVFKDLPAGAYAIAVSHDLNGNRSTDRNFIGLPREDWGVSNNVRPRMRAPRFEDAKVRLAANEVRTIPVRLGR